MIDPRKIRLLYANISPGCGFSLEKNLQRRTSKIPSETSAAKNPNLRNPACPSERFEKSNPVIRLGRDLRSGFQPDLATGIEALDKVLVFRFGQFAALHGKPSHDLSSLLCVKATLPQPLGPDSDVIFIDGGNIFDPYLISKHSIMHELKPENVLKRIHISRAFTYHQLTALVTDKLALAIEEFASKLIVISDITQLYCDPDIHGADEQDAFRIFDRTTRSLIALAEQKHVLIIATNPRLRNPRMEDTLTHKAHVSAKIADRDTSMQLMIMKHPWIPQLISTVPSTCNPTLEMYL
jgi:DNA repair protein RadA